MTSHIRTEPLPDGTALNQLVAAAIPDLLGYEMRDTDLSLLGHGQVLATDLSLPGRPTLAIDKEGVPVLICFNGGDGVRAVADGLAALAALNANDGFWVTLCPNLAKLEAGLTRLRLLVLIPEQDAEAFSFPIPRMEMLAMGAARVNGKLVLLTRPVKAAAEPPEPKAKPAKRPSRFRTGEISLSGDETRFFDRL